MGTLETERAQALLSWYRIQRRQLPWRDTGERYDVLVSEFMLQQTQVERVIAYFEAWMNRFPTVEDLAKASLADALSVWSGLGYNNRCKRLHDTAKIIASDGWPTSVEGLEELPGVGAYTARAIAAFALGKHVAATDTNLRRVLSRWYGEPLKGRALDVAANQSLADPARDWNQAMMDLGAVICRNHDPICNQCPVGAWCGGPGLILDVPRQTKFEGSARQVRGAVIRALVRRAPQSIVELVAATQFPTSHVLEATSSLATDGLVETEDGVVRLCE
ncbi:A/G-specific adenine glycosylase [hydrothermal vent metagenome]|uniref:Adenine DNA glycosylase n=1 Tax=hydrothermal vent metagenome TaxID=652676 RepID=A0A3B0TJN6_9ZZZZ